VNYSCPRCSMGQLRPARSTYAHRWGAFLLTRPNFPAWRCDCCGYTRYDVVALAEIELLTGPEDSPWEPFARRLPRDTEGPAERGPQRWSF